jgi:DnaK suppressor protein
LNGAVGPDIARLRQRLITARMAILDADATEADGAKAVELDQTRVGRVSRMDAMQAQAISLAAHDRRYQQLSRVNAALERIEQGEYGFCLECGEPIGIARLEIDPAATHCVQCASRIEQSD